MKHLPYWAGVKEDPRFELVEGDAMAWMREHGNRAGVSFDVVIWDLPDAVKETAWLYDKRNLELTKSLMHPDALFATHSGGDVCTKTQYKDSGYPGDPCYYTVWLHATLKVFWRHSPIAVSPLPYRMSCTPFRQRTTRN